jgi:hypothetical protein
MAKRKLSKSRKLPAVDTSAHDAETVRLVREWADTAAIPPWHLSGDDTTKAAWEVLRILNRKPAAKKGGKR